MNKLRIAVISGMVILLIGRLFLQLYVSYSQQKELDNQPYYELYSSYVKIREEYRIFLMVNPNQDKESIVNEIFTESYIQETIARMFNTGCGEHPIKVFLIEPSEELPYGWQKSELNISMNFDQAIFFQNTYCTVTIPLDAENIWECIRENY